MQPCPYPIGRGFLFRFAKRQRVSRRAPKVSREAAKRPRAQKSSRRGGTKPLKHKAYYSHITVPLFLFPCLIFWVGCNATILCCCVTHLYLWIIFSTGLCW